MWGEEVRGRNGPGVESLMERGTRSNPFLVFFLQIHSSFSFSRGFVCRFLRQYFRSRIRQPDSRFLLGSSLVVFVQVFKKLGWKSWTGLNRCFSFWFLRLNWRSCIWQPYADGFQGTNCVFLRYVCKSSVLISLAWVNFSLHSYIESDVSELAGNSFVLHFDYSYSLASDT